MRIAGILMPVTSLPSPYGIGTFGEDAYRFINFLCDAGCKVWQVLPLQPTSYGDSPYQSCSSGALNPYFIDLDFLCRDGLLEREDYCGLDWGSDPRRVDYGRQYALRANVLRKAFSRFDRSTPAFVNFLKEGKYRDYAVFMALKERFGGASFEMWEEYARYDEEKVSSFEAENRGVVEFWQFTQYLFLAQWRALKEYANSRGVEIMGDIPIYVGRDSVETWKYGKDLFLLNEEGLPSEQAGVPPDIFSDSGQLWGNPVYDWQKMKEDGYSWWHRRLRDALSLYDILRIDHFIGFVRYYTVPEGKTDARVGEWRKGPGAKLFRGFEKERIVAEDLGLLTDEVRAEIDKTGYPGMRILQHAFDGEPLNEHKPSNYPTNCVAYTGTHDNLTLLTRVEEVPEDQRTTFLIDLVRECRKAGVDLRVDTDRAICHSILRLLYASKAETVIFPLQDALVMGAEARINSAGFVTNANWSFRFLESDFSEQLCRLLKELAVESGRAPDKAV